MAVFKFNTVTLPYYAFDASTLAMQNDTLEIFIATDEGTGTIDWSTYVSADPLMNPSGYIVDMDSLEEGFDFKEGMYVLENMSFKALNIGEFWSTNIFNGTNTKIEMRIFAGSYSFISSSYTYEMIFYGVIIVDLYSVVHRTATTDDEYAETKEYSFNAYSFLKTLEEKPISELYRAIQNDKHLNPSEYISSQYADECIEYQTDPTHRKIISWNFIKARNYSQIKRILLNIISLASDITINSVSIVGDITYGTKKLDGTVVSSLSLGDLWIYIDNDDGTNFRSHFSDNKTIHAWSFNNFENCAQLLGNVLNSFGLVWNMKYTVTGTILPNNVSIDVEFVGRQDSTSIISISNLAESSEEVDSSKLRGMSVLLVDIGEYQTGETIESKETVMFNVVPELMSSTDLTDAILDSYWTYQQPIPLPDRPQNDYLSHCLYYYDSVNLRLIPVTNMTVATVNYKETVVASLIIPSDYPDTAAYLTFNVDTPNLLTLAKGIVSYYANSITGIFYKPKVKLKQRYLTIKGTLSGLTKYNNLKPTYRLSYDSVIYKISRVSKNLLDTTTEVEMVNYG